MRTIGLVLKIVAYIIGLNAIFYYGIIPIIGGVWSWNEWGVSLLLGLFVALIFMGVGDWLRNRRKITQNGKKIM